ncbi:MAG: hypothetical protein RL238_2201 [Actinomycetota bacterium]|jgi:uncharacterized membrane protein YgcG
MVAESCYVDGVLNPITKWRHAVVGLAALVTPLVVLMGLAGDGYWPERFDAKQVVVTAEGDGVRIREVVDQDFGNAQRHGYERIIPNDFGAPIDVVASSPDAPADVDVTNFGVETRIRIGDPGTLVTGQHRYVLEYTLPAARLDTGLFNLDVIGPGEQFETGRFEVVVTGLELDEPTCATGALGVLDGCTLDPVGDVYLVLLEPLPAGDGVTVAGTIVGTREPVEVPIPDVPVRRDAARLPMALGCLAFGVLGAIGSYEVMRKRGRNVVGGSSAVDAAFASTPGATRLVTDRELASMATTEFEPPRGMRPWQGALLLHERVDTETISAWFSDQIAQGVLVLSADGKRLSPGESLDEAPPVTRKRIERLLGNEPWLELGAYDPRLHELWEDIRKVQVDAARDTGWWERGSPGSKQSANAGQWLMGIAVVAIWSFSWLVGLRHSIPVTFAGAVLIPAAVGWFAYRPLLPRRSAAGSAAALQAESFRRFLVASEGRHVEWAWQHGLLREYSAWAVALGAASAWGRAVAASAVPPPEVALNTTPMLLYSTSAMWRSTHTVPPSTGGGSGGGGGSSFGGGFSSGGFSGVGGGGGGGSSGSW